MKRSIDLTKLTLYAAAALVSVALGVSLSLLIFERGPHAASSFGAAQLGGPFELTDVDGQVVTEDALQGKVSLIYFGYTYCPDYCPTELANLAEAEQLLEAAGVPAQVVFITIDPERDTADVLREYVSYFGDDILALGGDPQQVAAAARAYRVIYLKSPNPEFPDGYLVDHTTDVYATGADGAFAAKFRAATPPEEILRRLTAGDAGV